VSEPKKRKNGRAKGAKAELEVARLCVVWWDQVEPGCQFKRTPGSGGWATPEVRGEFKVAGDLTTTAKRWPFTVEVKRREGWVLANLYAAKPSPVWKWWRQACAAASEEGRTPILFLRKNARVPEWFVMVPEQQFRDVVPRLCSPLFRPATTLVGDVQPLLTTWETLRSLPVRRIIKACRAVASTQADSKTISRFIREVTTLEQDVEPHPTERRRPRKPRQAGASSRAAQADKQTQGYFALITGKPGPELRVNKQSRPR
jgi:hypothetical protein